LRFSCAIRLWRYDAPILTREVRLARGELCYVRCRTGCAPLEPVGRFSQCAPELAACRSRRLAALTLTFSRQDAAGCDRASAAGLAARRRRLLAPHAVWCARGNWRMAV